MNTPENETQAIYTVSQLNSEAKFLLEDTFPSIWVEGEISNFAAPNSGHWYFSLKDPSAQVRCCLFRGNQRGLGFIPKDGMHVLIRARVSLYENRGEFQLIADFMEERGEGKLRRAYEALKKKLQAAGLFDEDHKIGFPEFPRQIGVITSPTGAAIKDILHVLKRRFPCAPIIIYPTPVQGSTAAPALVKAIETANRRHECDVLILARGGGSLEDLWPFNEEMLAHAIYNSKLPIICGVGHEVDFSIADFVADQRAPTPSAAAEMMTPDKAELLIRLAKYQQQVDRSIMQKLASLKQHSQWIAKHLSQQHPKRRLAEKMQQLDFSEMTLVQLNVRFMNQLQTQLNELKHHLERQNPMQNIQHSTNQIAMSQQHLISLMKTSLTRHQNKLSATATQLDAISPLATLKRGYAIATDHQQQVIQNANTLKKGDQVNVRLRTGSIDCEVKSIQPAN